MANRNPKELLLGGMPVILYNGKLINFVCVKMRSVLFLRNLFPVHAFFINPCHPFHGNIN